MDNEHTGCLDGACLVSGVQLQAVFIVRQREVAFNRGIDIRCLVGFVYISRFNNSLIP